MSLLKEVKINESFNIHFTKHELFVLEEGEKLKAYNYMEPNSSNGYMGIVLKGGTLMICGDYGDAIFQWTQQIDLEWLAGLNLQYFHGKCQASPVGSRFNEWDSEKAFSNLKSYLLSYFGNEYYIQETEKSLTELEEGKFEETILYLKSDELKSEDDIVLWKDLDDKQKWEFTITSFGEVSEKLLCENVWRELMETLNHEDLWASFVNNNSELFAEIFGPDYWEFLFNVGTKISFRCELLFEGIKRAFLASQNL